MRPCVVRFTRPQIHGFTKRFLATTTGRRLRPERGEKGEVVLRRLEYFTR